MKRAALISVIVGAALAIVPAAFAVEVSDGGGTVSQAKTVTMAPTSYQDALNTYGSTSTTRNSDGTSVVVTPLSELDPAIQAAVLRNGFTGRPDVLGGNGASSATSSSPSSIDWSAVIPAIALGVLLIAMTATIVTRRRHQHQLSV